MQKQLSVACATALVVLFASAALADGPKTPGERALRAATEAADSAAIQAALDQIEAEKHGGSAPPVAKPAEPSAAATPKEAPAPAKPEVSITSDEPAVHGVDLDRLPRNRRDGTRQLYHDLKDSGHTMTAKELKDWACGLFYSRDQADAATISLSGRVRELERKVDGIKAGQAAGAKQGGEKPPATGSADGKGKSGDPFAWASRNWGWMALAAIAICLLALLFLIGRRRGWSPLRWWRTRRGGGRRRPRVFTSDGPGPVVAPMPPVPPAANDPADMVVRLPPE